MNIRYFIAAGITATSLSIIANKPPQEMTKLQKEAPELKFLVHPKDGTIVEYDFLKTVQLDLPKNPKLKLALDTMKVAHLNKLK